MQRDGIAEQSNGAWVIQLPDEDGHEVPPCILMKSDGAFLYSTTDLAGIQERVFENRAARILIVADARQSLHFRQVFAAARRAGLLPEHVDIRHIGFGTVNGPDGKPYKTRDGDALPLAELIEHARQTMLARLAGDLPDRDATATILARSALVFADLISHRNSDYVFDLDRFTSLEGKTGPYLLYTIARARSVLRKAGEVETADVVVADHPAVRSLMRALGDAGEAIVRARAEYTPHLIAEHCYEIAQRFNALYQQVPLLNEVDVPRRAALLRVTSDTVTALDRLLGILNIQTVEQM
jgi:arginyl-tRNA synthetase